MTQDFPEQAGTKPAAPQHEPFGRGAGNGPGALGTAPGPETFVPIAAMEAMLAVRHDQIFRFGHTLEADLALSLDEFAKHLRRRVTACVEDLQFRVDPVIAQRHLAKLGALAMAIYDRLEAEKDRAQ